jgi:hypothetical protein
MKRDLIRITWTSRPDPVCKGLWDVYMDAVIRSRLVNKPFDKWAIKETDKALKRYFDAVEDELEWLNAE